MGASCDPKTRRPPSAVIWTPEGSEGVTSSSLIPGSTERRSVVSRRRCASFIQVSQLVIKGSERGRRPPTALLPRWSGSLSVAPLLRVPPPPPPPHSRLRTHPESPPLLWRLWERAKAGALSGLSGFDSAVWRSSLYIREGFWRQWLLCWFRLLYKHFIPKNNNKIKNL